MSGIFYFIYSLLWSWTGCSSEDAFNFIYNSITYLKNWNILLEMTINFRIISYFNLIVDTAEAHA